MRVLALVVVSTFSGGGCTGDPDGVADEPGHIYAAFGTGEQELDEAGKNLAFPLDLVIDPATGDAYIDDFNHYQIRSFSPDGSSRLIAGTGNLGIPVNGPAVEADFNHIGDLHLDGTGGLYVAAWHNSFVLRIDLASGELTRIAGTGTRTKYTGDGGPALAADLSMAASVALLPDGRLVVSDQDNQVVRAIDPATGIIDHFAGRCVVEFDAPCAAPVACPGSQKLACDLTRCDYSCSEGFLDGVSRDMARFAFPYGAQAMPGGKLAVGPDGSIYVTDYYNDRIRVIRSDGRIDTVANGLQPDDVAVSADGTVYAVDAVAGCVHRIDLDGTVTTVAGVCGERGFAGDNGLATAALFTRPSGIALDEVRHRLYIADTGNHRVRFVTLPR